MSNTKTITTLSIGHTANSSSRVVHVPQRLLEDHPDIRAFMEAYDLHEGLVGEDLWGRSTCDSVLLTREQKQEAKEALYSHEYSQPDRLPDFAVDDDDQAVIVYGDEYQGVGQILLRMIRERYDEIGHLPGQQYN